MKPSLPHRPTPAELLAAAGKTLPDVIALNLKILFCGINPGLYTAAIGHHFGRPGNRFWPTLYHAGFTERLLSPYEERDLLKSGYGISNVVAHATASAAELSDEDFRRGGERLRAKAKRYRPRILAILGIGAYRKAFDRPKATMGLQPDRIGDTPIWVLPNPSGLYANHQLHHLVALFTELRRFADRFPSHQAEKV